MLRRMLLHMAVATLLIASAAFAWQVMADGDGDGAGTTAGTLVRVLAD